MSVGQKAFLSRDETGRMLYTSLTNDTCKPRKRDGQDIITGFRENGEKRAKWGWNNRGGGRLQYSVEQQDGNKTKLKTQKLPPETLT